VARLYGGQVCVESVPDQGSTFTVTLQKEQAVNALSLGPTSAGAYQPAASESKL
jgi:hypothetical protein